MQEIKSYFERLNEEEKIKLNKILNNSSNPIKDLQKIIFNKIPPTPEQFLDPKNKWLPKPFIDSIYDWVKEDFYEMTSTKKHWNQIVLYGCTRQGKSFCAILLIMYIIVYVHHLRDMATYYNLASGTSLSLYILSFNYDKVYQIYLAPLYNLLEQSERFIQVRFQDQVKIDQKKYGFEKIVYSKAAVFGHLTLASGLKLVTGNNDVLNIIGNNILCGIISEISFFIENDGATEEGIFRLYSDLVERIAATVGKSYLSFTFLDTSANDKESLIEKYILNELSKKEDVVFRWRKRWDVKELVEKFCPIYHTTNETFPLFVGDGTKYPKILNQEEIGLYDNSLIQFVPIDFKSDFERNLIKSIKDICGIPTMSESKLFTQNEIIDNIFIDELENEISGIVADSIEPPSKLLFNKLDILKYFVKIDAGYYFRRSPKEVRYIGLDLAYSVKNDVVGFTIGHKEWSRDRQLTYYVNDMSFAILPGGNGINLDCVGCFAKDLKDSGIYIYNFIFDSFQSESLSQFLTREGINNQKNSIDKTINPYMNFYQLVLNGQFKTGKNIFLKNNLKSLYRVRKENKEKIDHSMGELVYVYDGDFNKSKCGINAKDVSDSCAQWVFIASQDEIIPLTCWEDENERLRKLRQGNNLDILEKYHKNIKLLINI